nr:PKD domain-containing protein [uncultured Brumimicrobium sp.]
MKAKKIFILLFAFLSYTQIVVSQVDSVFWFAAPWVTPSHADNDPVKFRISTFNKPTTVRIYQPAGGYDNTVVIPPNSLESVDLSAIINTLEAKPANTALDYGVKIVADTLVTVVYEILTTGNNPETFSLKGGNGVGTEFVTPFQTRWPNWNMSSGSTQPKQMFSIVATENNTTVWITPRTDIVGHPAGVTYSITLNEGQVYTAENIYQNVNQPGRSLSGSIITSDKPVAVTISEDSVTGEPRTCKDLMGDQIVPIEVIGNEYIVNKGSMFSDVQEGIFVVATQNFTEVTITSIGGTTTQQLNRGDTWNHTIVDDLSHVISDKPVYVLQATGFGCELGSAILPPINCSGSAQVSFTRTNNQGFFLNILCPTSAVNDFLLNGSNALIPGSAFDVVPGTGGLWSGCQLNFSSLTDIPVNSMNLLENTSDFFAMGVINGGTTTGTYYHYMSSFLRRTIIDAGPDTTLCNGDPSIALSGNIKGATSTGEWSVLNGTGSFQDATSLTTTYTPTASDYTQGELLFLLTSTGSCNPVTDTMRVNFIQSPIVSVDPDQTYCKNNIPNIIITGGVQFATTATWSSNGNGGVFGNPNNLTTTYTPSPAEIDADSVALFLTSAGSFFACDNDADTVVIRFTPAPQVTAGTDVNICSDETGVDLEGIIGGATTTGEWTTTGAGSFSPSQNDLTTTYLIDPTDVANGSFQLVLTSLDNQDCLAETDTLLVNITPQPTLDITTSDSICETNQLIPLTGTITNGFGAQWTTSGFGTIANSNSLNTSYTVSPVDTTNGYVDFFLSTTGVCSGNMDSLRVHFVKSPIVNAGADQQLCENAAVQLSGNITSPSPAGAWSSLGTGTFTPGNAFLSTVYIPSPGDVANGSVTLILESTNNYGCAAVKDTMEVLFREIPTADFNVASVCQYDNAVFIDNSSFSSGSLTNWEWIFGDGTTSTLSDPQHIYDQGGDYTVQLIVTGSNSCTDTLDQNLTVNYAPIPNFSNTVACEMNEIFFNDLSTIPLGSITDWNYNFYGFGSSTAQNPSFSFPIAGSYPVTLTTTSDFGCTADTTITVAVIQSPTADFSMNPNPALVGQDVQYTDLSTGTNILGWYWDFDDGEASNIQNPIHDYTNGGSYYVTLKVTDENNCTDTITKLITVELLPVLPTGFTPNGDGDNDVFIIRGGPFNSVDFKVYNNWGELIFTSTQQSDGWDGTYKGENAPLGVYTWTFVVEMGNGQIIKKSGDVTLIR